MTPIRSRGDRARFSGYYAERLIHSGDKSVVLEAADMESAGRVAIKLYTRKYNRTARKMEKKYNLPSEADVGLQLNPAGGERRNAHLVVTLGAGREYGKRRGSRYIVQEFVPGATLKKLISCEDARVARNTARWAAQMCAALSTVHEQGFVDRDLCSDNIVVNAGGDITLIDLGFAVPQDIVLEERGGTPGYMAPEQVAGEPLTCRTDIYALGVVLYEMLTGRMPYTSVIAGDTEAAQNRRRHDIMQQHLKAPPPALPQRVRERHPTLSDITARCLRKDPAERYSSVDEIHRQLSPGA